jgi:hypothetical protein
LVFCGGSKSSVVGVRNSKCLPFLHLFI